MPDPHAELLERANRALPSVRQWVTQTTGEHVSSARPVSSFGFSRLASYFPPALLEATPIARVNRIVVPPLTALGIKELSGLEQMPFTGITYAGMIFMHTTAASESTVFHELVHVLQWSALGVDDFILAYGIGLIEYGYAKNPFETIAFDLQSQFDRRMPIPDLAAAVGSDAHRTREWAADTFRRHGVVMGGSTS